jgi:hypothetical protein
VCPGLVLLFTYCPLQHRLYVNTSLLLFTFFTCTIIQRQLHFIYCVSCCCMNVVQKEWWAGESIGLHTAGDWCQSGCFIIGIATDWEAREAGLVSACTTCQQAAGRAVAADGKVNVKMFRVWQCKCWDVTVQHKICCDFHWALFASLHLFWFYETLDSVAIKPLYHLHRCLSSYLCLKNICPNINSLKHTCN